MSRYVLAIDQGTTSTRAIIFNHAGTIVSVGQKEHEQIFPRAGWAERYKARVGLPLATYFSGPKIRWILDNVDGAREKAERGDLLFGNTDTWTLWNLTGGPEGGIHIT